jgi:transposase
MTHSTTAPEASYTIERALYMATELAGKSWRLGFSNGGSGRRLTAIPAWDEAKLVQQIAAARKRFGLGEDAKVFACYEAGRDGFSVHRLLTKLGVINSVVDAASMKVDRKARRAKSDKIDVRKLLADLIRYVRGDREVWKVARVPSEEEEDARRLHREQERSKNEKKQHQTRIRSLLATQGVRVEGSLNRFLADLDAVRIWDGSPLPPGLRAEIERQGERLELVRAQLRDLENQQRARLKEKDKPEAIEKIDKLMKLRGIGMDSAWLLVMEMFGWRQFNNRREVGGSAGLGGTPYNTGESSHEQGISKAGNPRVRTRMVELAWLWVRYQPNSDLTRWYTKRFAGRSKRMRRVGIVGVARKLLIELWHLVEHDVAPRGAVINL